MGLYETQNRRGQSETLMLFSSKNKFNVRFNKKLSSCFILPRVSHSPVHPYFIKCTQKYPFWNSSVADILNHNMWQMIFIHERRFENMIFDLIFSAFLFFSGSVQVKISDNLSHFF
jgi:hypothetical protein